MRTSQRWVSQGLNPSYLLPLPPPGISMTESAIAGIELFHVGLPPRGEHKCPGLQEPIGGYIVLKMTDGDGRAGWGEAPALKDWGGEFGRYFGESPGTVRSVTSQYLAPAGARSRLMSSPVSS